MRNTKAKPEKRCFAQSDYEPYLRTVQATDNLIGVIEMLGLFQSPSAASWANKGSTGRPRWTDADRSRRAIARVGNDRLGDLSEAGRRIRQEVRRQHVCLQSKEITMSALSISSIETWSHARSPRLIKMIMVTIDAFREALEMRRAAHRSYPFYDE